MASEICCPDLDTSLWDHTEHYWEDKSFFSVPTFVISHMPLRVGMDIERCRKAARARGYELAKEPLILAQDGFLRGRVLYELADYPKGDTSVRHFHRTRFRSVISTENWNQIGRAMQRLLQWLRRDGLKPGGIYMWYTRCPDCVQKKGFLNVILAEIAG